LPLLCSSCGQPGLPEKRQGAGALQNLAEQLSTGTRFASWRAVALDRIGSGREILARLFILHRPAWGPQKTQKQKKPKDYRRDNFSVIGPTDSERPPISRKQKSSKLETRNKFKISDPIFFSPDFSCKSQGGSHSTFAHEKSGLAAFLPEGSRYLCPHVDAGTSSRPGSPSPIRQPGDPPGIQHRWN
jgi:hypothetical protein